MEKILSLQEFLELCRQCAEECKTCAENCKHQEGMDKCSIACYDCASVCLQITGSPNPGEGRIQNCIDACQTCASICETHSGVHFQSCAYFCKRCVEAGQNIEYTYFDFHNEGETVNHSIS